MLSSVEGSDVTDEPRRSDGGVSSESGGEMGVELSLRDNFLEENSDGFLPKMELLGAGEGSGILCMARRGSARDETSGANRLPA